MFVVKVDVDLIFFIVLIDQYVGMILVVDYFVVFGYWDILYLFGLLDWLDVRVRECVFYLWVKLWGICEWLIVVGDWLVDFVYDFVKGFIWFLEYMVVFVVNDDMVIGFIYGLYDWGFDVLIDFSVVGFDDVLFVCYFFLLFMMVCQDFGVFGVFVVEMLWVVIEGWDIFVLICILIEFVLCVFLVVLWEV